MIGRIAGVVLAGGQSRRMGCDKAMAVLRGRTLLARTVDRLAPQCAELVVSRRGSQKDEVALGYRRVDDGVDGSAGPLAGVLAALDGCAARNGMTHVATVAVDTPFLPADLVARLDAARRASGAVIACAASGGRVHPVAALWPVALRDDLRRLLLVDGCRRMLAALDRFGYATVEWPVAPYDPFLNLNTAEDLARAEGLAAALDARAGSPQ